MVERGEKKLLEATDVISLIKMQEKLKIIEKVLFGS